MAFASFFLDDHKHIYPRLSDTKEEGFVAMKFEYRRRRGVNL